MYVTRTWSAMTLLARMNEKKSLFGGGWLKAVVPAKGQGCRMSGDEVRLVMGYKVDGRWQVTKKLGQGSFGAVYEAVDTQKSIPSKGGTVALKLESVKAEDQVLKVEVAVMRAMVYSKHACKLYAAGRNDRFNFLLMSLLGQNLGDLRKKVGGKFSLKTTVVLGRQCLDAIKDMHDVGWLHRDIKPSNFAMGTDENTKRTVFILDFGLSRTYWTKEKKVRAPRPLVGFRGTMRYCSLNAHRGRELGRQDDLISLLYMMVEMSTGMTPWKQLTKENEVAMSKSKSASTLYNHLIPDLYQVHTYLYNLKCQDTPSYSMFEKQLTQILTLKEMDTCPLDWEAAPVSESGPEPKTPSETKVTKIAAEGDEEEEAEDDNKALPDLPLSKFRELVNSLSNRNVPKSRFRDIIQSVKEKRS